MEAPGKELWSRLVEYLGAPLVRYMLSSTNVWDFDNLTNRQRSTAASIAVAMSNQPLWEWDPVRRSQHIVTLFCTYSAEWGRTPASEFHIYSGGKKPDTRADDPAENALLELAADVYPTFLLPVGNKSVWSAHVAEHPQLKRVHSLLFQPEEPIMQLFPNADFVSHNPGDPPPDWLSTPSMVFFNDGSGTSFQFAMVVRSILAAASGAWDAGKCGVDAYLGSVRQMLAVARKLAIGEDAVVPAIIGCYNTAIVGGVHEIKFSQGRLRRVTPAETTHLDGVTAGTVVFEMPVTLRRIRERAGTAAVDSFRAQVNVPFKLAQMAAILSSGPEETQAIGKSFESWPNPLESESQVLPNGSPQPNHFAPSRALQQTDETIMQHWGDTFARVQSAWTKGQAKQFHKAQERLLSGATERHTRLDALIDAVVVWETLFGGKGETSLRVCAALAHLLVPNDPIGRFDFFGEVKKLYDKRSNAVHGSDHSPNLAVSGADRDKAVHIAISAWCRTLESPHLLQCADAIARSNRLIMGLTD
ncbi:hypothetical protein ABIE18_000144 [Arthrobacter sp. 2762]